MLEEILFALELALGVGCPVAEEMLGEDDD